MEENLCQGSCVFGCIKGLVFLAASRVLCFWLHQGSCLFLQAADPDAGPESKPKPGIQRLGKGGVDPVEEGHRGVRGRGVADAVEGQ